MSRHMIVRRRGALMSLAAGAMALGMAAGPALAEEAKIRMERTISVTGQGSVEVEPDAVSISVGVTSDAETAAAALAANSVAMEKAIATIKGAGIAAKDIQTSNFGVNPRYTNPRNGQPATITGYQVSNSVRMLLRDVKKLGSLLDAVTKAGSNQIGGISFLVTKADELRNDARKAAVANARAKAELYAAAAGAKIGRVLAIEEEGAATPRPVPYARSTQMMSAEAAPPIEAGSQRLDARVAVTYALE